MAADQQLGERLKRSLGDGVVNVQLDSKDPWVELSADAISDAAALLRDDPDLRFDMLNCISAVDYFHTDPKKASKAPWEPHLELVYHLSSTVTKERAVVKVSLPRWKDDREGELPEVSSVAHIWRTADWHEREIYDLMGIWFKGHPDLRRILCPEDWIGHPLRKDYQSPDSYHGIRDH